MPEPTSPKSNPGQDVRPADEVPTDQTSNPIIVSNRPMVRDPMFAEGQEKTEPAEMPDQDNTKMHREAGVTPQTSLKQADLKAAEGKADEQSKEKPPTPPEEHNDEDNSEPETKDVTEQTKEKFDEVEAAKQLEHDQTIQKMIDEKGYALPITNVEKRRNRRVVIFGAVISVILLLAWVDVALDAGIIHISGIKPVTHFFSN